MKAVHAKIKEHTCLDSGKSFSRKQTLEMHELTKNSKCDLCAYATSQASSLNLHVKAIHVEKRDIMCKLCDYATV